VPNTRLRKSLDLPAMTAVRFNPLVGSGKAKMAALGACMRRLLMICYGVLKGRTPFDPSRGVNMAS
jgi:transposase